MPRGDRDAPEGRAGREFRAAAGDSLRAGRGCGRGGFPCLLAGLAGLLLRLGAGRPVPPGGLAGLLLRFPRLLPGLAGRVAALFLQLRRGEDLARGGQPGCPPAQQVISQVMVHAGRAATRRTVFSDGAAWTPARLLSGQPSALSTRCGRLAAHSPTAVNESHPASRAAIATAITHATVNRTPRRSRGSGSRASQSHSDAGGPGSGENTRAAVTDWTGNGATFRTETSAIPVLPGLRCSSPAGRAAIRRILPISPAGHPGSQEHAPGAPAPPGAYAGHPRTRTPLTQRDQSSHPANHSPLHLLCRDPGGGVGSVVEVGGNVDTGKCGPCNAGLAAGKRR